MLSGERDNVSIYPAVILQIVQCIIVLQDSQGQLLIP